MNQRIYLLVFCAVIISPGLVLGYMPSAQFLTLPYTAAGSALSESQAAIPSLTATPYNPAALQVNKWEFTLSYTRHFADANLYTGIIGKRWGKFNLACLTKTFIIPEIEKRDIPSDDPIMTYSSNHFQLGFSSSYRPLSWVSLGGNASFVFEDIDYYQTQDFLYGMGFLVTPSIFSFGGSVINLGSLKEDKNEYKAPQSYNLMGSVKSPLKIKGNSPYILIAASKPDYTNLRMRFGITYKYAPFKVMLGYTTGEDSRNLSCGFSLNWRQFELSYSMVPFKNSLGWNHTISLQLTPSKKAYLGNNQ